MIATQSIDAAYETALRNNTNYVPEGAKFVVMYENAPRFKGLDMFFSRAGVTAMLGEATAFDTMSAAIEASQQHPVLDKAHLVARVRPVIERAQVVVRELV